MNEKSREEYIKSNISAIGREAFPDDEDLTWSVESLAHHENETYVEALATPAMVGYPRFRFVIDFSDPNNPENTACYEFDGNDWSLLFTSSGVKQDGPKSGCAGMIFVVFFLVFSICRVL